MKWYNSHLYKGFLFVAFQDELFMHLTNYSINKHNENFDRHDSNDSGSKRWEYFRFVCIIWKDSTVWKLNSLNLLNFLKVLKIFKWVVTINGLWCEFSLAKHNCKYMYFKGYLYFQSSFQSGIVGKLRIFFFVLYVGCAREDADSCSTPYSPFIPNVSARKPPGQWKRLFWNPWIWYFIG